MSDREPTGRYSTARVLDAWYAACRSDDLHERPIARTLFDAPLAFFRSAGGRASALLDRCAHRNSPLSLGSVDAAGHPPCPYHGWRFDDTGACREGPGLVERDASTGRKGPPHATCEQDGFVWGWARARPEPLCAPPRPRRPPNRPAPAPAGECLPPPLLARLVREGPPPEARRDAPGHGKTARPLSGSGRRDPARSAPPHPRARRRVLPLHPPRSHGP